MLSFKWRDIVTKSTVKWLSWLHYSLILDMTAVFCCQSILRKACKTNCKQWLFYLSTVDSNKFLIETLDNQNFVISSVRNTAVNIVICRMQFIILLLVLYFERYTGCNSKYRYIPSSSWNDEYVCHHKFSVYMMNGVMTVILCWSTKLAVFSVHQCTFQK